MFGSGISNDNQFINRAMDNLREFMTFDGLEFTYQRSVSPAWATVGFAKAWNRAVTGSINALIAHAAVWLAEGELSPFDVGFKLNDVPCIMLADGKGKTMGRPREAFKAMIATVAGS